VGEGNRLMNYKSLVADLSLTDRVQFMGWLNSSKIQSLSAQSSLGLFPSRVESFGLSVVEAMATGLPVIAASGGALQENVEEGVTGTLVPINNAGALAKAIISTLENLKHTESMAREAKKAVQHKFNWDKAANKMVDLYSFSNRM
jgi:glycosyltransferase involved in cell wall biosynthesis